MTRLLGKRYAVAQQKNRQQGRLNPIKSVEQSTSQKRSTVEIRLQGKLGLSYRRIARE